MDNGCCSLLDIEISNLRQLFPPICKGSGHFCLFIWGPAIFPLVVRGLAIFPPVCKGSGYFLLAPFPFSFTCIVWSVGLTDMLNSSCCFFCSTLYILYNISNTWNIKRGLNSPIISFRENPFVPFIVTLYLLCHTNQLVSPSLSFDEGAQTR